MAGLSFHPILITIDSLKLGGAETMLVNLVNRFDRSKLKTTVASLDAENPLTKRIQADAAEVIAIPRRFRYDLRPARMIKDVIRRNRVESILCFDLFDFFFVRLALLGLHNQHSKVLISMHRTSPESFKDYFQTFAYARMLRGGVKIISASNQQAAYLSKTYAILPWHFRTIYNGIDLRYFHPNQVKESKAKIRRRFGISKDASVILQVANFGAAKCHEDALTALQLLRQRRPDLNAVLIFVGGGNDMRQSMLRSMSLQMGIGESVIFLGVHEDIRPFYRMSDCFTLSSWTETFSMAALEAMAMGLPCVLTNVGGAREMVREGIDGFLVPVGRPAALARRWRDVLDSKNVFSSKNIRQHIVERFSIERCVHEYENLLLE